MAGVEEVVLWSLGISDSAYEIFEELQLAAHSIVLHCRQYVKSYPVAASSNLNYGLLDARKPCL